MAKTKQEKKQHPRIMLSKLCKPSRWFVVTKYREAMGMDIATGADHPYLVAVEKFDVTEQMESIFRSRESRR